MDNKSRLVKDNQIYVPMTGYKRRLINEITQAALMDSEEQAERCKINVPSLNSYLRYKSIVHSSIGAECNALEG